MPQPRPWPPPPSPLPPLPPHSHSSPLFPGHPQQNPIRSQKAGGPLTWYERILLPRHQAGHTWEWAQSSKITSLVKTSSLRLFFSSVTFELATGTLHLSSSKPNRYLLTISQLVEGPRNISAMFAFLQTRTLFYILYFNSTCFLTEHAYC